MPDPLQELLSAGVVPTTSLSPTSRYADVGTAAHTPADTPIDKVSDHEPTSVAYFKRRLVPRPEEFATLYEYSCVEGDRRDTVAAQELSDPDLWWRIADANGVIDPSRMTRPPGRRLRITSEQGVPGGADE
jgi:hypothetical protein